PAVTLCQRSSSPLSPYTTLCRSAIAIDDQEPQIININEGETTPDWEYPAWWNNAVADHIRKKRSSHGTIKAGRHKLKIWMIDPRSEEHTSELQSRENLVCRLLLE